MTNTLLPMNLIRFLHTLVLLLPVKEITVETNPTKIINKIQVLVRF